MASSRVSLKLADNPKIHKIKPVVFIFKVPYDNLLLLLLVVLLVLLVLPQLLSIYISPPFR